MLATRLTYIFLRYNNIIVFQLRPKNFIKINEIIKTKFEGSKILL